MRTLFITLIYAFGIASYAQDASIGIIASSGSKLKSASASVSYTIGEIVVPLSSVGKASSQQGITGIAASNVTVKKLRDNFLQPIDIQFFPNPFSTFINANIGDNKFEQLEYTVYDVNGRVIRREVFSGQSQRLSINTYNWLPGNYFLTVSERNGQIVGSYQIIKQQ